MKRRQRRISTSEFKHEAACLTLDQGYAYRQACEFLVITATALWNWVNQLKEKKKRVYAQVSRNDNRAAAEPDVGLKSESTRTREDHLKKLPPLLMSDAFN